MEDHNYSFSTINLAQGDTTNAMLLSSGGDQPINATESDVESANYYESDVTLNMLEDAVLNQAIKMS